MKVKLFWKEDCPKCPSSKEVCKTLEADGIEVEYFDIQSVDGMAEAAFYSVLSTPTTVVVSREGGELLCWRGVAPDRREICRLRDS